MPFRGVERRKHPRYDFSDTVDYLITQSGKDVPLCGLILNICESGLCLYTSDPLSVGQKLTIETSLDAHPVKAEIKWVKEYRSDLFKAGAMFVE